MMHRICITRRGITRTYDASKFWPQLTKKQRAELLRLSREAQQRWGKGRARTQNTLVALGLARWGTSAWTVQGRTVPFDACVITVSGLAVARGR